MIVRKHLLHLQKRIEKEPRHFIQVLYGPRQIGKTTLITQYINKTILPNHYVTADNIPAGSNSWLALQWESARQLVKNNSSAEAILIIDEIQKIENWSEQVKKEWDEDTFNKLNLKVVLLGSSRLLLQQGLTESLAGRYETTYMSHWSFNEMQKAFGLTAEQYVWYGGYPGPATLIEDEKRWKQYINDSLIETSISKDILMLTRVDKPAMMRRLFEIGCAYSGQILSYSKIVGQLHDAGNTTTLAHYLQLLNSAGLLGGIEKYNPGKLRQRASSPKFQVHNTGLISAQQPYLLEDIKRQPDSWGRWVESAIGAHLLNYSLSEHFQVYYWRHRNNEIDFVITNQKKVVGIEVKSGNTQKMPGMDAFMTIFNPDKVLLVGKSGIPWEEFLKINPRELF